MNAKLALPLFCDNEYSESLSSMVVEITPELIAEVKPLAAIVREHGLFQVEKLQSWGDFYTGFIEQDDVGFIEEEPARVDCESLLVRVDGIAFSAAQKHSRDTCTSEMIYFSNLGLEFNDEGQLVDVLPRAA